MSQIQMTKHTSVKFYEIYVLDLHQTRKLIQQQAVSFSFRYLHSLLHVISFLTANYLHTYIIRQKCVAIKDPLVNETFSSKILDQLPSTGKISVEYFPFSNL